MAAVLAGAISTSLMFNAIGGSAMAELPFYYHLVMGGFAFGCVFMATDPVTAAQTNIGKWIYGLLIGFLVILIRVKNSAYPEGMMLAIQLMNVFAPLIDYIVVWFNIRKRTRRAAIK
jgi:Na+-transporting NADH:ubiquinone oxidoreductase subunit B